MKPKKEIRHSNLLDLVKNAETSGLAINIASREDLLNLFDFDRTEVVHCGEVKQNGRNIKFESHSSFNIDAIRKKDYTYSFQPYSRCITYNTWSKCAYKEVPHSYLVLCLSSLTGDRVFVSILAFETHCVASISLGGMEKSIFVLDESHKMSVLKPFSFVNSEEFSQNLKRKLVLVIKRLFK